MRVFDLSALGYKLPYSKLYYLGEIPSKRFVGIVGSRQASREYCNFAYELGKAFSQNGFCVVSGFAQGIDISAHLGCLDWGDEGSILAILATPLDSVYPAEHQSLIPKVLEKKGAVATINPGDLPVAKSDFVLRNSVIAAFCEVVFFIQGSIKSGARHTVKFALEYGKDVYVCPGPPWDPNCAGTNQLIKDGSPIITSIEDALEIFGIKTSGCKLNLSNDEKLVLSVVKSVKPCYTELLFESLGLSVERLETALEGLEQKGVIELLFTGEVILKSFNNFEDY